MVTKDQKMNPEVADKIACKLETQALYLEQQIDLLKIVTEKLQVLEDNGAPAEARKRVEMIITDLRNSVKSLDESLKDIWARR
jgi:predicted RNA methylase